MSIADLSVVVVGHNVAAYLQDCLDSLARQTVEADIEVVIVDDGSTDATGAIAEKVSAGRPGWQVVHTDNRGPGRARNVGLERTTGRWLAFLDGDDLLPRRSYERLLASATRTGSDLVTGGVRRWDGSTLTTAPLHRLALTDPLERGHLTRDTRLVYDSCVWNKIILRSTWDAGGHTFPVGVVYEDLPVAFAMHLAARSTDVVPEPVYIWRRRTGTNLSITQRLSERDSLEQRMAALQTIDALALDASGSNLRDAHDAKVIDIDLRRMVAHLPGGDDAYRARFLDLANDFLAHVPKHILAERNPLQKLIVEAIVDRELATLLDLAVARNINDRPEGLARLRLLAPDLRVQRQMRQRRLLTGLSWLHSTSNRMVYHLLPERIGQAAADRRYERSRPIDVLSI